MSGTGDGATKYIVPFSYGITVFVPILAPLFAYFLLREDHPGHAVGVIVLAVAVVAGLVAFVL